MPILEVEIVTFPGEKISPDLAHHLAHRAGEVLASGAGRTWVKLRLIPSDQYAENNAAPLAVYPVFVSVLKATLPEPDVMQREVTGLVTAVAQLCQRPPENVHIIYLPAANGRVAFGGKIV